MPSYWDNYVFCSPFCEPLSINDLAKPSPGENGVEVEFDIPDPAWNAEVQIEVTETANCVADFIARMLGRH
jgi:hypothetical protein